MSHQVAFRGSPLTLAGPELRVGDHIPDFVLTGTDLADVTSKHFHGKKLIISVVPSLDTPVCSTQTKHFNQEAASLGDDVSVLTVSMDLPFALKRWCGAEGVTRVTTASDHKYRKFGQDYGVFIEEMAVLARAVFVVDKSGKVAYAEYVPEVSAEPNYDAAIEALKKLP